MLVDGARSRRRLLPPAVRSLELGNRLDAFLICAVGTIVVIRFQLWLTNYPQLGSGGLHIAHMLWGGLAMMLTIGILLSFASRAWRMPAAILGGIGFGFFVDEIGKFITADNDYFFQPTAAIIYVIFIGLFMGARTLQRRRGFTREEELAGAVDILKEAAWRDLDSDERRRAAELLDRSDPRNPLTAALVELVARLPAAPSHQPVWLARLADGARRGYFRVIRARHFPAALTALFIGLAALSLVQTVMLLFAAEIAARGGDASNFLGHFGDEAGSLSVGEALHLASSVVSGAFMIAGVYQLRHSRLAAYRLFDRALLIQILVVQFFALLESEFSALAGLLLYLLLFVTLRYVMKEEEVAGARSGSPGQEVAAGAPRRGAPAPSP